MKYIFLIIALLMQPIFSWYVYHKQEARKSALKVPMLFYSGFYLVVQIYIFIKFCSKFPEEYYIYSYLIQAVLLIVFLFLEFLLFVSNQYIEDVGKKEQDSIRDFKKMIQELENCRIRMTDVDNRKRLNELIEKMKYSDPVSAQNIAAENQKIHELIVEIAGITEKELFVKKCDEIERQLEIRKIKNTKEE